MCMIISLVSVFPLQTLYIPVCFFYHLRIMQASFHNVNLKLLSWFHFKVHYIYLDKGSFLIGRTQHFFPIPALQNAIWSIPLISYTSLFHHTHLSLQYRCSIAFAVPHHLLNDSVLYVCGADEMLQNCG